MTVQKKPTYEEVRQEQESLNVPEAGRVHRWRRTRSYQFPAARQFLTDTTVQPPISGWVVNVQHATPLYGVVRYFPYGDSAAWVESETSFADEAQAESWVKTTMASLKAELHPTGATKKP